MKLSIPNYPSSSSLKSLFLPSPHPSKKHHRSTITMSTVATACHRYGTPHRRKEKLLVILGATGAGKSRLSVDLATIFPSSEIINSDKIQVYSGLDIATNKIPTADRRGVPHHLLGCFRHDHLDFTPSMFRSVASSLVTAIHSRRGLPILVGGSNSFVHALVTSHFDPDSEVFDGAAEAPCPRGELRYECCFLWVDVSPPVLYEYLDRRVDEMLEEGMVEELRGYYEPGRADYSRGLRRAIGVEEFDRCFERCQGLASGDDDERRRGAYEGAVRGIRVNTRQLAKRQMGKIVRLREVGGWDLRRLDATESFRELLMMTSDWRGVWERDVLMPSVEIMKDFLQE